MNGWIEISVKSPEEGMSLLLLLQENNSDRTIEIKGWWHDGKIGIWNHHFPDDKEYKFIAWKEDPDEATTD